MFLPSPLAHHSLLWKPLPANSTASRTGASLPRPPPVGSSPHTASDSNHGKAMLTPKPRRIVLRVKSCFMDLLLRGISRNCEFRVLTHLGWMERENNLFLRHTVSQQVIRDAFFGHVFF